MMRVAWRLARGSRRRLALIIACVACGIAASVAVSLLVHRAEAALQREASGLLTADLAVDSAQPLSEVRPHIRKQLPPGSTLVRYRGTLSMLRSGTDDLARPVQLQAVSAGWPQRGQVSWRDADGVLHTDVAILHGDEAVAVVQPELLAQLGQDIGSTVVVGDESFRIVGVIESLPGLGPRLFASGPVVLIDDARMDATGLTGLGARIQHSLLIALPAPALIETVAVRLRQVLDIPEDDRSRFSGRGGPSDALQLRTPLDASARAERGLNRLADFLRLTALTSLALAGIGLAALIQGHLSEQLASQAILRTLGASRRRVAALLRWQLLGIGLAGGMLGALLGWGFCELLMYFARDVAPMALPATIPWWLLPRALVLAVAVTILASWLPLLRSARATPLSLLREEIPPVSWRADLPRALIVVVALVAWAAWEARSLPLGLAYGGGVLGSLVVLRLGAAVVLPVMAGFATGAPPRARLALRNLRRPGYRPAAAVVTIGLAGTALAFLAFYEASIAAHLDPGQEEAPPQLFVVDIQHDQIESFRALLDRFDAEAFLAPYLRARLRAIDGEPVSVPANGGREADRRAWARLREHNLSWRSELSRDETLLAGNWMPVAEAVPPGEPAEASVETMMADLLGIGIGSRLLFDAQGVDIPVVVTSIREVDWSFRPNFFLLVQPDVLRAAPLIWVGAIGGLSEDARSELQLQAARAFPNVSLFDVQRIGMQVRELIGRMLVVIRYIAGASLAAGLLVLVGLALATARSRRHDAVLLRVLGARRRDLLLSLAYEQACIGLAAAVLGMIGALILASVVLGWQLSLPIIIPWLAMAVIMTILIVATTAIGYLASRSATAAPPLALLRQE